MEPAHLAFATIPLAVYLLWLGRLNVSRHPRVTTGMRDIAALAFGLCGFVVVGPMRLFTPQAAAFRFGPVIWLLLLTFYGLCVTLWLLLSRPKLLVFNQTLDEFLPVLRGVMAQLDPNVAWAGDNAAAPQLGVQFHVEEYTPMRNLTLVATGERQSFTGWRKLEAAIAAALRDVSVVPNPKGVSFLVLAIVMLIYPVWLAVADYQLLAQQLWELFRV